MIDEKLEFSISQYADGTLPAGEIPALEARLANDSEARELADAYRRLTGLTQAALPLPAIDWNRLAQHISSAIDEQEEQGRKNYVLPWVHSARKLAIAACVLLASGVGIVTFVVTQSGTPRVKPTTTGGKDLAAKTDIRIVNVASTTGQPTVTVSPSPTYVANGYANNPVASTPSRTLVLIDQAPDADLSPYSPQAPY
ncbi:MAG TPA: hypothetical protein VIL86_06285 [Tepidisphaeraceae bacterium]|jgi:anti-sigma factor RsiW